MTTYVDDMLMAAEVRNGNTVHRSRWSHLTADTLDELHEFAVRKLGLKRSWFQDGRHPHYDLTEGMRWKALRLGAQPVEYGQSPDIARRAAEAARVQAAGETGEPPVNSITGPGAVSLLLLTGPREGATWADVEGALRPRFCKDTVLLAGGARGVDKMGAWLWRSWGGQVEEDPVSPEEWDRNPQAGYDRNDRMIARVVGEGGKVVAVIAPCEKPPCRRPRPHITHGTAHCVTQAERAGLAVDRVPVAGAVPEPEPPGHHWKDTAVPGQKQCTGCGTFATRTWLPGQQGWNVSFHIPGQVQPSDAPPPCREAERGTGRAREREAAPPLPSAEPPGGIGCEPGTRARRTAGGRILRVGKHTETVECDCGEAFERPLGETYSSCLRCEGAERLAAAGIGADDEGLQKAVAWNSAMGAAYPEREQEARLAEPEHQGDAEATT